MYWASKRQPTAFLSLSISSVLPPHIVSGALFASQIGKVFTLHDACTTHGGEGVPYLSCSVVGTLSVLLLQSVLWSCTAQVTPLVLPFPLERKHQPLRFSGHSSPWDAGSRCCPVPSLSWDVCGPVQSQVSLLAATGV